MAFALYQVRWVGGEEKVKEQRKEKETVSWCLPYRGGQYGIYQVSLIQQEGRRSWPWHQSSHSLSHLLIQHAAPQGNGEEGRTWGGSSWPVSWCWPAQASCQAPPSVTPLWPESAHSMARPWTWSIFPTSGIAAYILGIGKIGSFTSDWEDVPDGHWINSANKREKNMWAQGDFLTIYRIGGIVYFPISPKESIYEFHFMTSNRQVGRDMAVKIRWWLINGLATGFNTQIYNYLYFFA